MPLVWEMEEDSGEDETLLTAQPPWFQAEEKKRKPAHAHCPLKGPRARSPKTYSCPEISQKRIWK